MTELERLTHQETLLKSLIRDMQGYTFYREDTLGNLKRWTPPRVETVFDKKVNS